MQVCVVVCLYVAFHGLEVYPGWTFIHQQMGKLLHPCDPELKLAGMENGCLTQFKFHNLHLESS